LSNSSSPSFLKNKIILRVSSLSHLEYCCKRSKIESFYKLEPLPVINGKGIAIIIGNRLHFQYSFGYKDFDRVLVRHRLGGTKRIFEKTIKVDDIEATIRGKYDDLKIIRYKDKKYTSVIEVKTISKKYMWSREIKSAIKQLEMYMWLMKEELEKLGYPLWRRSYIEVYSQRNGMLIRRIPVIYNNDIEEWIKDAIRKFKGLLPMQVPPRAYCKLCPRNVRGLCSWWKAMEEDKRRKDI